MKHLDIAWPVEGAMQVLAIIIHQCPHFTDETRKADGSSNNDLQKVIHWEVAGEI